MMIRGQPWHILNEMKYSVLSLIYDNSMLRLLIAIVTFLSHKSDVAIRYCDASTMKEKKINILLKLY